MSAHERLDLDEIRALIRLAAEADITELDVDAPHVKVRIKKGRPPAPAAPAAADPRPEAPAEAPHAEARYVPITAPMVGTFYRASNPDAPPFIQEGDAVEIGQTVCVLEAMKMFNEIASEVAGRIAQVLVENGAPVEYGQPLFLVAPTAAS
jgi:acetyl-CoA carboxylase biotin carboxyl carrier protein